MVIAILCTMLLILAGFALKIFVIGSPAHEGELIASGFEEENGVLLVNPGSAGRYCRGGRPRAKLMEIDRGQVRIRDILL